MSETWQYEFIEEFKRLGGAFVRTTGTGSLRWQLGTRTFDFPNPDKATHDTPTQRQNYTANVRRVLEAHYREFPETRTQSVKANGDKPNEVEDRLEKLTGGGTTTTVSQFKFDIVVPPVSPFKFDIVVPQPQPHNPLQCGQCKYLGVSSGRLRRHMQTRHIPKATAQPPPNSNLDALSVLIHGEITRLKDENTKLTEENTHLKHTLSKAAAAFEALTQALSSST